MNGIEYRPAELSKMMCDEMDGVVSTQVDRIRGSRTIITRGWKRGCAPFGRQFYLHTH